MNLRRSSYFSITEKPTKGGALVAQLVKLAPQSTEAMSSPQHPGVIFQPQALCCMSSLLSLSLFPVTLCPRHDVPWQNNSVSCLLQLFHWHLNQDWGGPSPEFGQSASDHFQGLWWGQMDPSSRSILSLQSVSHTYTLLGQPWYMLYFYVFLSVGPTHSAWEREMISGVASFL